MKPLAVFLTLVTLAGAYVAPSSSPPEQEKDTWEYIRTLNNITQESWDSLRNSKQGQEIITLITNTYNTMKNNQAELMAEAQKLMEKLVENAQPHTDELKERVKVLMVEGQERLVAAWNQAQGSLMDRTESLRESMNVILEDVVQKMEQSTEHVLGTSSEALKAKVRKDIQEFRQNIQQQLQPRLRQVKMIMQQVARKVSSYNESFQSNFFNDLRRAFNTVMNPLWQSFQ